MTRLVIDASVAIKWVVSETGTAEALALRRFRLIAPDLLSAECANILWKKVQRSELTGPAAGFAAGALERADITLFPMRRIMQAATSRAVALGHPAYDCFYLVLADLENVNFVTADDRLVRKLASFPAPHRAITLSKSTLLTA